MKSMVFSEEIRNYLYWGLDKLKGGKVRKNYADVCHIMQSRNEREAFTIIQRRLYEILLHAVQTTAFYKNIDVSKGIDFFPVINKNLIRAKQKDFLSTKFREEERFALVTSGSTGTPFKTFQSLDKKNRNTADTIFFAELAGYKLGNKLYYFKIWSEHNKKSSFVKMAQNIVPIDVLNLQANSHLIVNELNKNRSPVSFLGYVSAFETLCKELDKKNDLLPLKVNSIITMSESLGENTKQECERLFNCPVLSRYSNIENGILAQQTLMRKELFLINKASYYIEVMDLDKDENVQNGKLGRIVVTDFFNKAMPLIRYDTGDLGIKDVCKINGINQEVFVKIEGRKLDQIYNTRGELISSYIVYKNMWKYIEIEQYQFIQKSPLEYVFKICISKVFKREAELISEFKKFLGDDAIFKVEYVHEIPLLDSGKRRKVVNEFYH